MAVGGTGRHGVVATANYVARSYGVHSAMAMGEARRRCADLVIVAPDFAWYHELSFEVLAAVAEVVPDIEPAGLDESYLGFGDVGWDGIEGVVVDLRSRVRDRTGLAITVGVGVGRGIAKLASGAAKPDGLLIVRPAETSRFLAKTRLRDLGGAGPATLARLEAIGIESVEALGALSEHEVAEALGASGLSLWQKARGEDGTELYAAGAPVSVGSEETLEYSVGDLDSFTHEVARLGREAARRLGRLGMGARGVTLKARGVSFNDVSRAQSFGAPTNDWYVVARALESLVGPTWDQVGGAVRLVGVTLTGLSDSVQERLPFGEQRAEWALGRSPRTGERVMHKRFGVGRVIVGDPDTAVVRFSDRVRVMGSPREHLKVVEG